jgi:hypothetical protein
MNQIIAVIVVIAAFSAPVFAIDSATSYLMQKIIEGDAGEVSLFLEGEHSPDVRDSEGTPALLVATEHGKPQVVRVLLEWEANPNLTNAAGMTALMIAAHKKSLDILTALLQSGADVNQQNSFTGKTALMYAVQTQFTEGVQLLLEKLADVSLRNQNGTNALKIADAQGYTEIVQMLNQSLAAGETDTASTSTAASTNLSDYIRESKLLLNQQNFSLAREMLKDAYKATGEPVLLFKWIEVDERLFEQLKVKNKQNALSQRYDDTVFNQSWNFLANRSRQVQYEKEHPISTLPISEVDDVIEGYEQLKLSVVKLDQILPKVENDSAEMRQLVDKYQAFAEQMNLTRYDYISFDVISPYLARADQQIFLADNAYYFSISYSSELLHEAVKTLAKSTHQGLIFDSYPVVRKQFVTVYKTLMELGEDDVKEFEEFQAIQTVADKLVPNWDMAPEK